MTALLKTFWDITLWRSDPSHLPDSRQVLLLAAGAYALTSAIQSWMIFGSDLLLARTAADLALAYAVFWLLLSLTGRRHRLNQTVSAALGAAALLAPIVIVLLALKPAAEGNYAIALAVWAASTAVIVWYTFVISHIVRAALDIGPATAFGVAIAYIVINVVVLTRLFPDGA